VGLAVSYLIGIYLGMIGLPRRKAKRKKNENFWVGLIIGIASVLGWQKMAMRRASGQ